MRPDCWPLAEGVLQNAFLLTNATLFPLWGEKIVSALGTMGARVRPIIIADGESHKTMETALFVCDELLRGGALRQSLLLTLGGGVVSDLGGFAAAIYMRGISWAALPTTLVAQVDAAIGGKTGVNRGLKNILGAFHPPRAVLIDPQTLSTLPMREHLAGLAEVVKYGAIGQEGFFSWLEGNANALLQKEEKVLLLAIGRSVQAKIEIVTQDEKETSGLRALLNFGHTLGHAIESNTGFSWLHGEAVAAGMVFASKLSVRLGYLAESASQRLEALISRLGLPTRLPEGSPEGYLEPLTLDKKRGRKGLAFVLLRRLGEAFVAEVEESAVRSLLEEELGA